MAATDPAIPREARNRFENLSGVPLDVIAELFERMELPHSLQAAFWATVADKDLRFIHGKVRVRTKRDGKKEVVILSTPPVTFQVPDDLTDEQLGELKRAQSNRLPVGVSYQVEADGKRPVREVEVDEAEAGRPGGSDKHFY